MAAPPDRLRLALIGQSYPPMVSGAALVVQRLAEGLAARGHAVLVLAASDRGSAYIQDEGALRVARLRAFDNPLRVGQRFAGWPRRAVAEALNAFAPDLVHLHDPLAMGLAGLSAAQARAWPVLLTLHQLPWFLSASLPRRLAAPARMIESAAWAYYRWWARQAARLIAPSRMIADLLRARGVGDPVAISNGVDLARFSPTPALAEEGGGLRRKYALNPELPILLHVGRLDADKNVEEVIRAAAVALRAAAGQLVIVGDGRRRGALRRLAEAEGLAGRAHFTGYVSSLGDLPGLYRLAAAFVTASTVEIQSSVVLEAAASGVPVVAVRASSMAEFVEDGRTGYLTPPGAVDELGARLAQLLREPQAAQELGRAGRALAERHAPEQTIRAHVELYQALFAERVQGQAGPGLRLGAL